MSNPDHVTVEITNWLERVDEITRLAAEFDEENDGISSSYHTVRLSETSDPQGRVLQKWNKIFQIACVLAILVDPLFLYIHVVKEDMKCLQMDINLQKIALSFRSVADLLYVIDITFQIFRLQAKAFRGYSKTLISGATIRWKREKSTKRILWGSIVVDGLAVLPIPQVVVFIFFSKMRGSGSFTTILLNFLIMLQYVPRVLRIYLSDNTISIQTRVGIWTKAVLNFLPFIIAGHVLGAMWYFFAIQRETACWESTCRITNECKLKTFDCEDSRFRNFTLLNELCPTNPPNATVFDFGIFLGAIQLSTQESTTFFKKVVAMFLVGSTKFEFFGFKPPEQ